METGGKSQDSSFSLFLSGWKWIDYIFIQFLIMDSFNSWLQFGIIGQNNISQNMHYFSSFVFNLNTFSATCSSSNMRMSCTFFCLHAPFNMLGEQMTQCLHLETISKREQVTFTTHFLSRWLMNISVICCDPITPKSLTGLHQFLRSLRAKQQTCH